MLNLVVLSVALIAVGTVFVKNQALAGAVVGAAAGIAGSFISSHATARAAVLDRQNALRLAAVDRRLEAHQKAFFLLHELRDVRGIREQLDRTVNECYLHWVNNSLYLSPDVRNRFRKAYSDMQNWEPLEDQRRDIMDGWREAVSAVESAVGLPPLSVEPDRE